jgi:hypothetical protein
MATHTMSFVIVVFVSGQMAEPLTADGEVPMAIRIEGE